MPILGLRTCIYRIADGEMAAARDWYSHAFGINPYFDEPFYVGFNIAGYELGLHPAMKALRRGENVEAYWGVADIQAAYDHMITVGAKPHEPPTSVGDGIWAATVKDPWGNIIGIIQNPHFKVA